MTADAAALTRPHPIAAAYRARTPGSAALAARAERSLPGGDTRAVTHHAPYALAFASGAGAELTDVDGNRYLDLLGNYTSLVHGNAYAPIVEAVSEQLRRGTAWAARHEPQVVLAELLCERVASVERVRFTNSGTEAAMLALHLARAATGRPGVLMARGGYHGSHEATEAGTHHDVPERQPIAARATYLADYGDVDGFTRVLEEHGHDIAAVFLEPVLGAGGISEAPPGFLAAVAEAARAGGALLVIDEVIAFRLATGGLQAVHGVVPDLTLFGKLVGGGFPVGAVGGRADVLSLTDPAVGKLPASGTFNGNPVTAVAGAVSVEHLTADRIATMALHAQRLEDHLVRAAADAGLRMCVTRAGSLLNLWFLDHPQPGRHHRDDAVTVAKFHLAAAVHGVHLAPRGMVVLSTAFSEPLVDEAGERLAAAMEDVAATA